MGSRAVSTGENKIISHYDIEQKVEQIAALRILRLYSTALKFKTLQYFFNHSVRLLQFLAWHIRVVTKNCSGN
jgi:hypothetical protein